MSNRVKIKRGYSTARDATLAAEEISVQIKQLEDTIVFLFVSSSYDLEILGTALKRNFPNEQIIACTTAGEITPDGFADNTLTGFSISSPDLHAAPFFIPSIRSMDGEKTKLLSTDLNNELKRFHRRYPDGKSFGFLLVDGLSIKEEQLVAILSSSVGSIPIIGGSAGDDMKIDKTYIYWDGQFVSDAAIFTIFHTSLPFKTIKTQHFAPSDIRLVITDADPEKRIVYEINGLPAADEYARLVGISPDKLDPSIFSTSPLLLQLGGQYYIRSIQSVNNDKSLTFFCAIEEGLVLRIAKGENMKANLENAFMEVRTDIPDIAITIGCDCVLRKLEAYDKDITKELGEVMKQNNVIGFHTYGEQFNSVHVNQTFTAIVIGEGE